MEQKTTLVKKILNTLLEFFSGLLLFIPFVITVQGSEALHQLLLKARYRQNILHMTERTETMWYVVFALCLPYIFYLGGKNIWRSKVLWKGFFKAVTLCIATLLVLFFIFILGK